MGHFFFGAASFLAGAGAATSGLITGAGADTGAWAGAAEGAGMAGIAGLLFLGLGSSCSFGLRFFSCKRHHKQDDTLADCRCPAGRAWMPPYQACIAVRIHSPSPEIMLQLCACMHAQIF